MKRTVIISGANRGLGKGFVDNLINDKDIFIISLSRRLSSEQKNYSKKQFHFLEIDLNEDDISEKLNTLNEIIGREPLYFINNASIIEPISNIENLDKDAIDRILSVNVKSSVLIFTYLLKHFSKNKLTFVNISSGAAERPIKNWGLYCSTKAFMQMFLEVAQEEYHQHNFYNINPGVLDTGMQETLRNSDFPDVENFRQLEQENQLKSPLDVSNDILKTIQIF
jgi:benzil reductase ((S)-benzoin forming)